MIERFNFFDVYGYLLPGAFLLALGWLPVGIVAGAWPPAEIELALVGGIASYLLGHLLHITHRYLFTVTEKDAQGMARYPHDLLMDEADTTFTPALKRQIADHIQKRFGIEVTNGGDAVDGSLERRRFDAFQLCRRWLIQEKSVSYAEQFQGLYELRRGLAAGCLATTFLYLGYALASLFPPLGSERWDEVAALGLSLLAAGLSLRFPRRLFWCFAAILFAAGFVAGGWLGIQEWQGALLACLGLVLGWAGWQFRGSFRTFTREFAATVYRDFLVFATSDRQAKPER